MTTCPLCRSEVDRLERLVLDLGILYVDGKAIRLTKREYLLMEAMLDIHPRVASEDFILLRLYPDDDEPEQGRNCLTVFICEIRKKIKGTALDIINVWGQGRRLELREAS